MKRIKVLECIRQGQIGGGESHLLSLVENIDRSIFELVVLSFTEGPMVERLHQIGVKTEVIYTERPFDFSKWVKIKKWMQRENFDLVHAHGTRANSNILWAARSLNIPVIYTIHGWSFHDDQNAILKKIRILGEKHLTSKSTINISVSLSNKETGQKHFRSFRSIVINNGIDNIKFNPLKEFKNIRKELKIPDDALLVLFLARFTHQKQPLALLKAFIEATKQNPKLYLLMVGDGEQKAEAIDIVTKTSMKERILLFPFRQDVPDILHAADVFVLPSLWEGLPISLLEAMAMGKAIIATRVDGTCEIIQDQQNGILIETNALQENLTKAILKISTQDDLRLKLQKNASKTIKNNFDATTMTRKIEKIYQQVIAN